MNKYLKQILIFIMILGLGNQVYNHYDARLGIIIMLCNTYPFFKLLNILTNDNELEELKTQQAIIKSMGLTKEILYKEFIDKWDGKTPLYGIAPEFLNITK